ncbi:FAD-binding domain [Paraburkholderia sp. A3BS-1L]|uniref:FAD-binding domain n=1 Tax=Paraburkholderia sp. A3BS-1L TaxID=3028375 RepID=UPI003DA8BCE5
MATANRRILICGAGIAGPSLAHRLLRYGFEPTIIERANSFRDGGYMIDVWGTGYDIVERYGLLRPVQERAYQFDSLKFVDGRGREVSGFGGAVLRKALSGRFFSIPRGDLARTIYDTISERVEVLYGVSIHSMIQNAQGVLVELSSGQRRCFDLLIGADGLHSRVRELVFGKEAQFERYLGYIAASFIVDGYPHRDEATYVSFARPGRQISRYAMREGRSAFLLVLAEIPKPGVAAHDLAAQKARLHARFACDGWETREILAQLDTTRDLYFDAVSQIRMPRWTRGRVALLGDAAHSPSLLAGAGAAFAMLGAYVLAEELNAANGDFARAFAAYEQRLRGFMLRQQDAAARFAGSFTPRSRIGLLLRDCVVNLMNVPQIGAWLAPRMLGERFLFPGD